MLHTNSQEKVGVLVQPTNVNDDFCVICTDSLQSPTDDGNKAVERLPACNHQFHQTCICRFFQHPNSQLKCPICRVDISNQDKLDMQTNYRQIRAQLRTQQNLNRRRSFVYIIARNYKPALATEDPLVFAIGHRAPIGVYRADDDPWPYQRWGVPGGLENSTDPNAFHIAIRELLEETKGARGTDTNLTVGDAMNLFNAIGAKAVQAHATVNDYYTAFMIKIDSAEVFERIFMMPVAMRTANKMKVHMSRETTGYCWLKVQDLINVQRSQQTPQQRSFPYTMIQGIPHPLRLRNGAFTQFGFQQALNAYTSI